MRDGRGIWLVDSDSEERKLLLEVGGCRVGRSIELTPDGKGMIYSETATAGEIWLATFKKGSGQ